VKAINQRVQEADKILQVFAEQRGWFKKYYCSTFDEAQKSSTIKPDLLQASIYYIQQQ